MNELSFIEKCLLGQARPEEIDDYVDIWHESDSPLELYEFLGMTKEEYSIWLLNPCSLGQIVKSPSQNPHP